MEIKDLIFTDSLPKIDLHGYKCEQIEYYVNDFIQDNITMKNKFIVIIHGIGANIIKNEVHKALKKNKNVLDYKLEFRNPGSTIVKIK